MWHAAVMCCQLVCCSNETNRSGQNKSLGKNDLKKKTVVAPLFHYHPDCVSMVTTLILKFMKKIPEV